MEVPCITGDGSAVYAVSASNIGISGSANRTVTFWAKIASTADQAFLGWGTSILGQNFQLLVYTGKYYFNGEGAADYNTGVVPDTTAWHHHAVTYNGTTVIWYVDGTLIGSAARTLNTTNGLLNVLRASYGSFNSAASVCDVRLYSVVKDSTERAAIQRGAADSTGLVAHYPLQDGPGTGNTNRTCYDVTTTANHLTLTNGTVATIWANRCPYAQDHFFNYGGRVASGVAIPGRLTGSLAADGNALTHVAGKHGNPYSRMVPNVWNAPALVNIGYTSSTKLAPTDATQSISTTDTKFRRTASDGDDRYFAVREALTGSEKTNAEAYVA
jgi:hypothetical protein